MEVTWRHHFYVDFKHVWMLFMTPNWFKFDFLKLPFHLDFDLSGSEDGEAGTNLLSNYPKPTHQHDFDFQPVSLASKLSFSFVSLKSCQLDPRKLTSQPDFNLKPGV